MTLSNTCSTRVDGWWMVIATVRFLLHIEDRVSAIVRAVVESALFRWVSVRPAARASTVFGSTTKG